MSAITHPFSNIPISLQTIHPTLQTAAREMTGAEFCAFTEQVRDHYANGWHTELTYLFKSRNIEPSMRSARQLIFARMQTFGEPPPVGIIGEMKTDLAKELVINPSGPDDTVSPETHAGDLLRALLSGLQNPWDTKDRLKSAPWEDWLFDVDLLAAWRGEVFTAVTNGIWKELARQYHSMGNHRTALALLGLVSASIKADWCRSRRDDDTRKECVDNLSDLINSGYLRLDYLEEAEALLSASKAYEQSGWSQVQYYTKFRIGWTRRSLS